MLFLSESSYSAPSSFVNMSIERVPEDKLLQLNENFLLSIQKVYETSPTSDFRAHFLDYTKKLGTIIQDYQQQISSQPGTETSSNDTVCTVQGTSIVDSNLNGDTTKTILATVERELSADHIQKKGTEAESEVSRGVQEERVVERTNHISWHEYFMSVAQLAAKRSKDPSTQVGACIVNVQNKIVATGYNGMPNGVHDNLVPWRKAGPFLETKYAYVVHAELNAILNCVLTDQTGCRVYVSLFPCNECAKAIIQVGIRHVIYLSDKHKERESTKAAKMMFRLAGVLFEQYSSLSS